MSPLIFFLNAAMKISRLTRLLTNNTLPPWQKICRAISSIFSKLPPLPSSQKGLVASCPLVNWTKIVLGKIFFCLFLPSLQKLCWAIFLLIASCLQCAVPASSKLLSFAALSHLPCISVSLSSGLYPQVNKQALSFLEKNQLGNIFRATLKRLIEQD